MHPRLLWIGGLAAGAAALVGVGVYMSKKTTAASSSSGGGTSSSPTGGTAVGQIAVGRISGGVDVVLQADGTTSPATVAPVAGQAVNFYIAGIGTWGDNTAANNSGAASGLSSIAIPNSGAEVGSAIYSGTQATSNIALNWVDTGGAAHTTNVAIT